MTCRASFFLSLGLTLFAAAPCRADVGLIVLEPVGPLGFFTRVGHVGTYFSNICPDGSPVKMRLCHPGERGGVVSKYSPLSENEDYDWAIVPFDEYMQGVESPELAPMIATRKLQRAIERNRFGPLFARALTPATDGELPDGQWRAALATRFDRNIYIYTVTTAVADDAALVAAFNAAPNKSRFNFFYRNCSDQARRIFDLILPDLEGIGDRTGGISMETPKGLAKALVARGLEHPELHLRVRRYPQIPGTFSRSRNVLFPMENTYRSVAFAPWWFFKGYSYVALGAMFYHEVLSPFDLLESSRNFISPASLPLTIEQRRLRLRQDEIRHALATVQSQDREWTRLSVLNTYVVRRLGEIEHEKRAAVTQVVGSKARWQRLDREFRAMVRTLSRQPFVPEALKQTLTRFRPDGSLSRQLLQYFEAHGEFSIDDAGRGPWLSLTLANERAASTGLSASHVLGGDPRLAVLILAAVIDYNLHQSEARREDIEYVEAVFTLLREASGTLEADRLTSAGVAAVSSSRWTGCALVRTPPDCSSPASAPSPARGRR